MVAILFTFFGYLLGRWEPNQNKDIVALKSSTSNEPSIKTHLPPLNSLDKDRNIVPLNSEEFSLLYFSLEFKWLYVLYLNSSFHYVS